MQEDACSICYGDMQERGSRAAPELVWCQAGCGHNVHARCLNVWGKHQVCSQCQCCMSYSCLKTVVTGHTVSRIIAGEDKLKMPCSAIASTTQHTQAKQQCMLLRQRSAQHNADHCNVTSILTKAVQLAHISRRGNCVQHYSTAPVRYAASSPQLLAALHGRTLIHRARQGHDSRAQGMHMMSDNAEQHDSLHYA